MTCPRSTTADECTDDTPCSGCRYEAACFERISDPPGAVTLPAPTPGGDQR